MSANDLTIGIAGLGTVGTGVIRILHAERTYGGSDRTVVLKGVSARDRRRDRGVALDDVAWFDNPVALARSDVDVFVELIGGEGGVALEAVEAALDAGKAVVTANKALLAAHGMALVEKAEAANAPLLYEAAVAGGIPAIRTVRDYLAGVPIASVLGIMNGTCNYILSEMEMGGY
ncbi:MAG: homoserine dehydrogenase, partial [Pseudomonadota bacterium]